MQALADLIKKFCGKLLPFFSKLDCFRVVVGNAYTTETQQLTKGQCQNFFLRSNNE